MAPKLGLYINFTTVNEEGDEKRPDTNFVRNFLDQHTLRLEEHLQASEQGVQWYWIG